MQPPADAKAQEGGGIIHKKVSENSYKGQRIIKANAQGFLTIREGCGRVTGKTIRRPGKKKAHCKKKLRDSLSIGMLCAERACRDKMIMRK